MLTGWRGRQVQRGLAWLPLISIPGNILCSHMERYPEISKTLSAKPSQQGKIPTLKGSRFTTHHYISAKPLFSGTQKIPSSLTKEFTEISHLLTWLSKGFRLVLHWCLLFSPLFLFTGTHWSNLEPTTHWRFSHIISWRCLWETNDKPYLHLKDRVVWS